MLSKDQIREIVDSHLELTEKTGLINGGLTEIGIFKIDPPKAMKWKGTPAWEIDLIYDMNVSVTEGRTSSSREYRYRKTLVLDETGKVLHATKPKLIMDIQGPEFNLEM